MSFGALTWDIICVGGNSEKHTFKTVVRVSLVFYPYFKIKKGRGTETSSVNDI